MTIFCGGICYRCMITLIAESKTMAEPELPVSKEDFDAHCPVGEKIADEVMRHVTSMSAPEIAAAIKISPALAAKVARMAYEFPNKSTGLRAIEAFTGVVFREFDYLSLSAKEKVMVNGKVRIISSLYGWLSPADIIKPYRFDFTTRLAPDGRTFSEFWRKDVTIRLVKYLENSGETTILNLLPADAAKCIDWKLVKRFAKVWKVDVKQLKDGGGWKTPHAGKLKAVRGEILRNIITLDIDDPTGLMTLETDNLLPLGVPDYPDHIAFCV